MLLNIIIDIGLWTYYVNKYWNASKGFVRGPSYTKEEKDDHQKIGV